MHVTKSKPIIAVKDVATVFDAGRIQDLASIAKLSPDADLEALGYWIREAAHFLSIEALIPAANQLHREIATLYKAAEARKFKAVADLLAKLSPEATEFLSTNAGLAVADLSKAELKRVTVSDRDGKTRTRSARPPFALTLPCPSDFRDEALREQACDRLTSLCRIGARLVDGRGRPSGKRSRSIIPYLNAPTASRHFRKREAERHFVHRLSTAWYKATGKRPPRTARRAGDSRDIGPFARLVRECLRLVGAGYADPIALINQMSAISPDGADCDLSTNNP
jgi:hypothetical protein